MIYYLPWIDRVLLIFYNDGLSFLLDEETCSVGSLTHGLVVSWDWEFVGCL